MAGSPRIGVLALQGDVREHVRMLGGLGAQAVPFRRAEELPGLDGVVLPGGESSVMDKLLRAFGLAGPLRAAIDSGLPVYGTCAGLILLADTILDGISGQRGLGGLDVTVRRNAFGSQLESFEVDLDVPEWPDRRAHVAFIRAPVVESVGDRARVLATLPDGRIVAVEQGNLLGTSFHPEVAGETRFHERFLGLVARR